MLLLCWVWEGENESEQKKSQQPGAYAVQGKQQIKPLIHGAAHVT